jgi:hypothetical protein
MTIVRVGSTGKYAEGWDKAFGKSRGPTTVNRKKSGKKRDARKSAAKKAARKS